jgi:signal transduction histidine kinase
MKDEFVSIVSHELRTPLTIIKNYLWLVTHENKDQVGPDALKKIQIVIQSTERLMLLVEDTLTVSRIENGKISLKKEPLDLVARVEYILDIYHIQAEAKGIRVVLETDLETANIHADINKIHEVIINVYGNALKFTPRDGVIRIQIRKSDDGAMYQISITDTGPGIPTEKQDKLFTKFGKIDESYANLPNINGTGLGLYISQEIMKLHGGSITVESEYGHGATFIVNLPIGE